MEAKSSSPLTLVVAVYKSYTAMTTFPDTAMFMFLPATACYCERDPIQTPLRWGTNVAQSITSWCMKGTSVSARWTQISKTDCMPTIVPSTTKETRPMTTATPIPTATATGTADHGEVCACGTPIDPPCCTRNNGKRAMRRYALRNILLDTRHFTL